MKAINFISIVTLLLFCPFSLKGQNTINEGVFKPLVQDFTPDDSWVIYSKFYRNNPNQTVLYHQPSHKIISSLSQNARFFNQDEIVQFKKDSLSIKTINLEDLFSISDVIKYELWLNKTEIITQTKQNEVLFIDEHKKIWNQFSNAVNYEVDRHSKKTLVTTSEKKDDVTTFNLFYVDGSSKQTTKIGSFSTQPQVLNWGNNTNRFLIRVDNKLYWYKSPTSTPIITTLPLQVGQTLKLIKTFISHDDELVYFIYYTFDETKQKKKGEVEIWKSNDLHLEEKNIKAPQLEKFQVYWELEKNELTSWNDDNFPTLLFFNHSKYFLNFNPFTYKDYIKNNTDLTLYLFDRHTKTRKQITNRIEYPNENLSYNEDGHSILFKELNQKFWKIYDVEKQQYFTIPYQLTQPPIWSKDKSKFYFFDSNHFYSYNLKTNEVTLIQSFKSQMPLRFQVLNQKTYSDQVQHNGDFVNLRMFVPDDVVYIEVKDTKDNSTTIYSYNSITLVFQKLVHSLDRLSQYKINSQTSSIYYRKENFNLPYQLVYYNGKSEQIIDQNIKKEEELKNHRSQVIYYKGYNGENLKGVLLYPINYNPSKKYPLIVDIYEKKSSVATIFYEETYENPIGVNPLLFNLNNYFYFLADLDFKKGNPGKSGLKILLRAVKKLKEIPQVDLQNSGLIGHSFGGYQTSFYLTQTKFFKAGVAGAGIHDLTMEYYSYNYNFSQPGYWRFESPQFNIGKPYADVPKLYQKNSPILYTNQMKAPLLLWTGKEDYNVFWHQSVQMANALRRYKKEHQLLLYPNEGHSFIQQSNQEDLTKRILHWFNFYLKKDKEVE
ncbi:alpha/beta hydrolase family protein [Faecalibacter rhinopitheci]|uniref:S9 family peptidase n=1 Tax=Faecalibacter rhinopitheci TaxID=2779678 RepID=A0A8J7FX49_9FLAO|nr:prolyl oligopeptidase family serine peptidase [Faecalibacter rhinopitheci]MBF0598331.1 S9 family peptidase [Faecalibacter rhinopitheci]